LDRRLGGPQHRSERYGEEKNLVLAGNQAPILGRLKRRLAVIRVKSLDELSDIFLPFKGSQPDETCKFSISFVVYFYDSICRN
jgi:hypothetical protein